MIFRKHELKEKHKQSREIPMTKKIASRTGPPTVTGFMQRKTVVIKTDTK